jgi:hypothetical protein
MVFLRRLIIAEAAEAQRMKADRILPPVTCVQWLAKLTIGHKKTNSPSPLLALILEPSQPARSIK